MVTAGFDAADGVAHAIPASQLEDALAEFSNNDPVGPSLPSDCYTGNRNVDLWIVDVDLHIVRVADREVDVDVEFRSKQEAEYGRDGQTCTDWLQRYRMAQHADGVWRIENSRSLVDPVDCSDE